MYIATWYGVKVGYFTNGGPWNYWSEVRKEALPYESTEALKQRLLEVSEDFKHRIGREIRIEYIHPLNLA